MCVFRKNSGILKNTTQKPEDSLDYFKSRGMSLASINIVVQIQSVKERSKSI